MERVYDAEGRVVRRVIVEGGWRIVQVAQPGGGWWNISVERV